MSLQEEKEKVQAQKEEIFSHLNDVLENELQCIICSEYFVEVMASGGSRLFALSGAWAIRAPTAIGKHSEGLFFRELLVAV